jgi:hypothetical protein
MRKTGYEEIVSKGREMGSRRMFLDHIYSRARHLDVPKLILSGRLHTGFEV